MAGPPASDRERDGPVLEFSYHRGIAPTLGVLLGLAIVEAAVLHLIAVALWGWHVALLLGVLDLSLVVALVGLLRAIRRYPVTIAGGVLTMRLGGLRGIAVPLAQVAGLRESWDAATLGRRDVVNLALASWPNVVVDLTTPIRTKRREVVAIAHKLDDPASFAEAIAERVRLRNEQ